MLFATIYFANSFSLKRKNYDVLVPLACIALFVAHPIGRSVWFFSLYWLIPVIARFAFPNNLFAKSLGASFTAHAVGGVIWIYFVGMPASMWLALIPIVAFERLVFAAGISASYIAFNVVLDKLDSWNPRLELARFVSINPKYVLK
jgi:uncharacterized membrane protein YccF (DUF307 family)